MKTVRFVLCLWILILAEPSVFAQVEHLLSPGELSKAHSSLSGIKNCNVCHGSDKNVLEQKCLECHKDLAARIKSGKGYHANKRTQCMTCHTEHLGKDFDIRGLDLSTFHHDQTGWKLEGKHALIKDCASCHKTRSFLGLKTTCESCHIDRHKGQLPNCESCHSVQRAMKEVNFDHSKTRFQLTGSHLKVQCAQCHKNEVYKGLPFANCTSCHVDPHKGSLGANCTNCHTTDSYKSVAIKHDKFPLVGGHKSVPCQKCHVGGKWKLPAFQKCADCHTDPHLGQFGKQPACEDCHNVNGFKPAKVNHDLFKLENGHAIPCAKCHKMEKGIFPAGSGSAIRYKPMRTDCAACHKDVHGGQFGNKCEQCHTTASFKLKTFDHSKTRFPLNRDHSKVLCDQCHKKDPKTGVKQFKPLSTNCSACHTDVHLGQLGANCERCHSPSGTNVNHDQTAFPLMGKHNTVPCEKCHVREKGQFPAGIGTAVRYKPIATNCRQCHEDYHRGQLKETCENCHNTEGFKPSTFNHSSSAFNLAGAHIKVPCEKCHKPEVFSNPPPAVTRTRFKPISQECAGCHTDPHKNQFGKDCARCHNVESFRTSTRIFHKETKFPLDGRHLTVACRDCHLNSVFKGTPSTCYDCHWIRRQDDVFRTRLGTQCEKCHTTAAWSNASFNHAAETGVTLSASHKILGCNTCHKNQVFNQVNCLDCHRKDYDNSTRPNHRAAGLPTTCENCHKVNDNSWGRANFQHNQFFPLAGRHATATCVSCHTTGTYKGTPRNCYGCHRTDYDQARAPNHKAAGFPTNCESCHKFNDQTWQRADFKHDQFFPLVGRHSSASCESCHKTGTYKGTPRNCFGCHRQDYDSTQNPNHRQAGFSQNCESCHRPTDSSWRGSAFNHNSVFPLIGRHATASCAACHKNGIYKGTPKDCFGCHRTDFEQTRAPNHRSSGFSTNCETCHKPSDSSWRGANFNHNSFFPLVGRHSTASCASCHRNNVYKGTPKDCFGCHRTDFDRTRNPNHRSSGFSTNCETCHKPTDSSWRGANFNHNNFFPLAGRHSTASCASCHRNNVYRGTPRDCYNCHRTDYDTTRNPNHRAAGFPTGCDSCHRFQDSTWNQGRFDHRFPIRSGEHAGNACNACHTNPSNMRIFTCVNCHVRSETDHDHRGVGGYRFDSQACYACHPNGQEND